MKTVGIASGYFCLERSSLELKQEFSTCFAQHLTNWGLSFPMSNLKKLIAVVLPSHEILTCDPSNECFTITAEILARSLANFYCQYADRHMNL